MNTQKLKRLVRDCGRSKIQIADESGITRQTLDNALNGQDIRVSVLEGIASALNVRVGDLFDDPPAQTMTTINQSGGSNTQTAAPAPLWEQLREKDAQIRALLDIIGKLSASVSGAAEKH